MTNKKAIEILKAKLTCMHLEDSACIEEGCSRDCDACDYNYTQGTRGEQEEALRIAINTFEEREQYYQLLCQYRLFGTVDEVAEAFRTQNKYPFDDLNTVNYDKDESCKITISRVIEMFEARLSCLNSIINGCFVECNCCEYADKQGTDSEKAHALILAIHALETQNKKVPCLFGDGMDKDGNIIYDMYHCPQCGRIYELEYEEYNFCPSCGQAIDWSWRNNDR